MPPLDRSFSLAPDVSFRNLTMVPLLRASAGALSYDTLDTALAQGTLQVTEVTDAGTVREIRVRNTASRPVLIIDGEELVGAKQNRTVNLSILVPAAADVIVPVTCVEAGRWSARSRHFRAAPRTHFAAGRAAKSTQVSFALSTHGVAHADQRAVWEQIDSISSRLETHSDTRAMGDIFEAHAGSIEAYVDALRPVEAQAGAVFLLDGEPAGVDLFDHPDGFRALMPKILRGYAMDAVARSRADSSTNGRAKLRGDAGARARRFMRRVMRAPRRQFRAPGLGETWRLFGVDVTGGLLSFNDSVLHLSAFPA